LNNNYLGIIFYDVTVIITSFLNPYIMSKNNQRDDFQSYNNEWEQNQNRYNDKDDYNQGNFGNVNYRANSHRDKNRMGDDRNYRNKDNRNYKDRAGSGQSNVNRNDWQNVSSGGYGASHGNNYMQDDDWNRGQGQWRDTSNYGQSYGTSGGYSSNEDRFRGMSGNREDNFRSGNRDVYGGKYNSGGYGDRNRGQESIYGGDTSNYGNANQGGVDRGWWDRTRDEVSSWFGDDDAERRRRMDEQRSGGHRGKGPKDYKRSADRIREDVCDRLSDDDYLDASNIEVKVDGDEAILTGTVSSREEKRRAEDLVESISGVRNVENRIRIDAGNSSYTRE
jgi:osmotically-inducible protein OsmY